MTQNKLTHTILNKNQTSNTKQHHQHVITSSTYNIINIIKVTLPPGVTAGDIIHVKAPDGRLNAITVPHGMPSGSTFTVEFAGDLPPQPEEEDLTPGVYVPTVVAEIETGMPYDNSVVGGYNSSGYGYGGGYGGGGMESGTAVVAQPTTGPYVPAYASK
mmetsp:Transcript_301/g.483  ORF Transcript_301/g.483 Transcript_301/m.483 type:complete len:159 (-) Transcript_301:200-676(-)|eukprot:CAMPEP_0196171458 /NCGR_PEP_ID=MMETSP0911-20130528/5460_1 /TAXON_ID=49265 /ORGANISM="Thalassiosira rotula, Strain GSO102" /LENGTH=158 /DNA_ID=CAMNT_0041438279 /DNA_START=109 /DNA_END=585 /DNA_ORIENTATION=+